MLDHDLLINGGFFAFCLICGVLTLCVSLVRVFTCDPEE